MLTMWWPRIAICIIFFENEAKKKITTEVSYDSFSVYIERAFLGETIEALKVFLAVLREQMLARTDS